jgi:transcriptional regulator with XRE-family HTH domain
MPVVTTSRNRLGHRLRAMRTERGWTLEQVHRNFGIDKGLLSRIERGEGNPSLLTLRKLRDVYTVDDQTFLSWIDLLHDGDAA